MKRSGKGRSAIAWKCDCNARPTASTTNGLTSGPSSSSCGQSFQVSSLGEGAPLESLMEPLMNTETLHSFVRPGFAV